MKSIYSTGKKTGFLTLLFAVAIAFATTPAAFSQDAYQVCVKEFSKISNQHHETKPSADFLRDLYQNVLNHAHPLASKAYDNPHNRAEAAYRFEVHGKGLLTRMAELRTCESNNGLTATAFPASESDLEGAIADLGAALVSRPSDAHDIRDRTDDLLDLLEANIELLTEAGFDDSDDVHAAGAIAGSTKDQLVVSRAAGLPEAFALNQNYPNPFNPTTMVSFDVPESSNVKVQVFDLQGRVVATLHDGFTNAGSYNVSFDAGTLSAGTYIYTIESGNIRLSKKMTLLK